MTLLSVPIYYISCDATVVCRAKRTNRSRCRLESTLKIIIIIIIIVRRFLTSRNMSLTLQGRAVSAAVQSGAVKQVQSLQCDFKGVDQLKGADVMSMPWMVNRSLVASTLFRSDRALKDANLSCGSGRPTWRCRADGSGLVETTLKWSKKLVDGSTSAFRKERLKGT